MKTENKTKTIQVRLTQTDYDWLTKAAYAMGTNTSALVRQLVQMSINAAKASEAFAEKAKEEKPKYVPLESEVNVDADD